MMDPATTGGFAAQGSPAAQAGFLAKLDHPATRVGGGVVSLAMLGVLFFGQRDIGTRIDAHDVELGDLKVWQATITAERKAETEQKAVAVKSYDRERAEHRTRQTERDKLHAVDRAAFAKTNAATLKLLGALTDQLTPPRRRR